MKKFCKIIFKQLPTKVFVLFTVSIFTSGLIFIASLYYLLNVQYQAPTVYSKLAGPVTTQPKSLRIDLDRPDNDTLSFDQSIVVSGKTGPNMAVLIMKDSQDFIIKAKPDGSFSTIINLIEGVNKITAVVFDSAGDSRSSERTVYYSKEKI